MKTISYCILSLSPPRPKLDIMLVDQTFDSELICKNTRTQSEILITKKRI